MLTPPVSEIACPADATSLLALQVDVSALFFLGQIGLGPTWQTGQVLRVDCTPGQYLALTGLPPPGAGRTVLNVMGAALPTIFIPYGEVPLGANTAAAIGWEMVSIERGWLTTDWDGRAADYDTALMPPGPQAGYVSPPPELLLADVLFAQGQFGWLLGLPWSL